MNIEFQVALRLLRSELARPKLAALAPLRLRHRPAPFRRNFFSTLKRQCHPEVASNLKTTDIPHVEQPPQIRSLPTSCPGCGALSQLGDGDEAGHYSVNRKSIRQYLYGDEIFHPENAYPVLLESEHDGKDITQVMANSVEHVVVPYCDRCHNLVHHNQGAPIAHPSLRSINEIIDSSPHKRNHVYHVLDAADFPMSIIPNLHERLSLGHVRSRNRRSKRHHFAHGGETDMSFIITRSDLLAPKKEQVDNLLPKLKEILRDAMGPFGKKARLHVRCVSAHRGWWTRAVKEEIWDRGGGQWLVGRVNVGKSGLLETVFPKGRNDGPDLKTLMKEAGRLESRSARDIEMLEENSDILPTEDLSGTFSLLPPPQPLMQYPTMPVISSLPGTTASPIRIPFGNRKGELIDLPGVERNDLLQYILPSERHKLVMHSRIKPDRISIKPGSSLLLGGGLIRITPTNPDQIVLAAVFAPLSTHLTNTPKAIALQTGEINSPAVVSIITPEARVEVARAGLFRLDTDITRAYSGPLTRRDAVGLKPDKLPFAVLGTDVLIAGCGWVELVAQVRRRRGETDEAMTRLIEGAGLADASMMLPEVEVWTPGGKGIGRRGCIEAWALGKPLGKR
jgi:genetic interactor of prohibitins 3, mitochondrial